MCFQQLAAGSLGSLGLGAAQTLTKLTAARPDQHRFWHSQLPLEAFFLSLPFFPSFTLTLKEKSTYYGSKIPRRTVWMLFWNTSEDSHLIFHWLIHLLMICHRIAAVWIWFEVCTAAVVLEACPFLDPPRPIRSSFTLWNKSAYSE